MTNKSLESLAAENRILVNQAAQLRYFLRGSRIDVRTVEDVEIGNTVYCDKDALHGIAAGLITAAEVCVDIGPGLRPQRLLECPVHLLVEPYLPYAEKLVTAYPGKPVLCCDGVSYLESCLARSADVVFLLDVIEHLDKRDGLRLLAEAVRVARQQVVVFTPLGYMPQHHSEAVAWEGVEHSDLQDHRSGWTPEEFSGARHVVCHDYHPGSDKTFGAFYSIIDPNASVRVTTRLVLVSDGVPGDFSFRPNDVIVADVMFSELSWKINSVPKRNIFIVPLQLIAEESGTPKEVLRRSVINFGVLEHYLERFENVVPVGFASEVVLQRFRNRWA